MSRPARVPPELRLRPFSLAEARAAGLTLKQLRTGPWRRIAPRTYAWTGLDLDPCAFLEAERCRLGPDVAFSGRTAAWLHTLSVDPFPIEVAIPGGAVLPRIGVRRGRLEDDEVIAVRGFVATSLPRTLRDLGAALPLVDLVALVDEALHRRLTRLPALWRYAAESAGRRGAPALRRALALADPAAESPMESRLRVMLVEAGLPPPTVQATLETVGARVDLFYPEARLCIEYDGATHRESLVGDNRRQNRLLAEGYQLLRFTAADVLGRPQAVVAQVRQALLSTQRPIRRAG